MKSSQNHAKLTAPMQVIAHIIDDMVMRAPVHEPLDALARRSGYDPTHFHKLFTSHVGVTPMQFQKYLNLKHARDLLSDGQTTEKTADIIGLSGTGRLYDLFMICEAVRPGDIQKRGMNLVIRYGLHDTRLGQLLIGTTENGICYLGFKVHDTEKDAQARMFDYWPAATFIHDPASGASYAAAIDARWFSGKKPTTPLPLDIHGSNFQLQVWRALLRIPTGALVSYHDIARAIGRESAPRAVGTAVGSNPISLLIPCHRVIQSSGIIENYGWGTPRKRVLIGIENRETS